MTQKVLKYKTVSTPDFALSYITWDLQPFA